MSVFLLWQESYCVRIFLLNRNFLLVHSYWTQIFFLYIGICIRRGWTIERKLHVDTLIFIPMWKINVCSYSRHIDNFCIMWRNISNSNVIPQKASLWNFLVNTLLLYIPLLTLTDRQNHRHRNKFTRYAWAGGTFFPVVLLCQFIVLAENRFWFYILLMYLEYHIVVVLC